MSMIGKYLGFTTLVLLAVLCTLIWSFDEGWGTDNHPKRSSIGGRDARFAVLATQWVASVAFAVTVW